MLAVGSIIRAITKVGRHGSVGGAALDRRLDPSL